MNTPHHLAKHIRDVHFGGNWTCTNLKDTLSDVTWQQATTKIDNFNSIATLVYHIHYFVLAANTVLTGLPLDSKDELSFNHPPITCESDWNQFLDEVFATGDSYFVEKSLNFMKTKINNVPITIMVSHQESIIKENCTRCILMKNGRIILDSTPDEAFAIYGSGNY